MEAKSTVNNAKRARPPRLSEAWTPFAQKLGAVLEKLVEDEILILSLKRSNLFIQFVSQGSFGMRSETVSNYYRDDAQQLDQQQTADLTDIGWQTPTRNPDESTPETDPDGSSNFFFDAIVPWQGMNLANVTVRTLVQVLKVSHPGFLEYDAFDSNGQSLPLPSLGLKRQIASDDGEKDGALPQLLLETIKELTGIDDWQFDEDGDIGGIRYGSVSTYARLIDDRPYVRFYATLIRDLEETQALFMRINELNGDNGHLHFVVKNGAVTALSDVLVTPFVTSHVAHALGNFCQTVDEVNDTLQAEFGGDAASIEQPPSRLTH